MPALLLANGSHLGDPARRTFDIDWLRPEALFGVSGMDPLTHGVLWSLSLNLAFYVGVSLLRSPDFGSGYRPPSSWTTRWDLKRPNAACLASRPRSATSRNWSSAFSGPSAQRCRLPSTLPGSDEEHSIAEITPIRKFARFVEHLLAGVLGTSSGAPGARNHAARRDMQPEDVVRLLDETSHVDPVHRELLPRRAREICPRGSASSTPTCAGPRGISVINSCSNIRTAWWPWAADRRSDPVQRKRGWVVSADVDAAVARRLAHMRAGKAHFTSGSCRTGRSWRFSAIRCRAADS